MGGWLREVIQAAWQSKTKKLAQMGKKSTPESLACCYAVITGRGRARRHIPAEGVEWQSRLALFTFGNATPPQIEKGIYWNV